MLTVRIMAPARTPISTAPPGIGRRLAAGKGSGNHALCDQFVCGYERLLNEPTGCDQRQVCSVAKELGLSELEAVAVLVDGLRALPHQAKERRSFVLDQVLDGAVRLDLITRLDD